MYSKVAGIVLFFEGRSPEKNSAIPATEEYIISLELRKECMVYLIYILLFNIITKFVFAE